MFEFLKALPDELVKFAENLPEHSIGKNLNLHTQMAYVKISRQSI